MHTKDGAVEANSKEEEEKEEEEETDEEAETWLIFSELAVIIDPDEAGGFGFARSPDAADGLNQHQRPLQLRYGNNCDYLYCAKSKHSEDVTDYRELDFSDADMAYGELDNDVPEHVRLLTEQHLLHGAVVVFVVVVLSRQLFDCMVAYRSYSWAVDACVLGNLPLQLRVSFVQTPIIRPAVLIERILVPVSSPPLNSFPVCFSGPKLTKYGLAGGSI
ncbi:hypothetical protein HK100_002037 [Physocladia obscura]|uniref:Uncharacterized protein n=1 Tax=Physocladia obscura TaxID=109957 RepID=A0AAD5XFQ0_9FUNG|nr:hypothetical protein HK100_002037 [Physocladia obscura]